MIPSLIIMLAVMRPVTFQARWPDMPSSITIDTYRAAVQAAARPSFCMWDYPGSGYHGCRVS